MARQQIDLLLAGILKDGVPIADGRVEFYEGGTSTQLPIYTSYEGGTSVTFVTLDAQGRANVYIDDTATTLVRMKIFDDEDAEYLDIPYANYSGGATTVTATAGEWIALTESPTYSDANTFTVPTDLSSLLTAKIAIKARLGVGSYVYSHVQSVSYGGGVTTVNLYTNVLTAALDEISYGLIGSLLTKDSLPENVVREDSNGDAGITRDLSVTRNVSAVVVTGTTVASTGAMTAGTGLTVTTGNITLSQAGATVDGRNLTNDGQTIDSATQYASPNSLVARNQDGDFYARIIYAQLDGLAGVATAVTNTTAASNTEYYFCGFLDYANGNRSAYSSSVFRFNPVTGLFTVDGHMYATGNLTLLGVLIGDVTGDVTGNLTGNVTGNVTGDVTGNVSGNAGTVTTADTTDATCFVGLFESATGNQACKTDGALTYNASTGALSATSFVGNGASLTSLAGANITSDTVVAGTKLKRVGSYSATGLAITQNTSIYIDGVYILTGFTQNAGANTVELQFRTTGTTWVTIASWTTSSDFPDPIMVISNGGNSSTGTWRLRRTDSGGGTAYLRGVSYNS